MADPEQARQEEYAGWNRLGRRLAQPIRVLLDAIANTLADGWVHAGNIAYLALVALLPLMILFATVASAFGQTYAGQEAINAALSALPANIAELFRPVIDEVLQARVGSLLWIGGIVALWTVTTFIETLRDVIRRAFKAPPDRGFIGSRLRSIGGLLVAVLIVMLLFVSQVVLGLIVGTVLRVLPYTVDVPGWLDWSRVLTVATLFLSLWALYRLLAPRAFKHCICWPGAGITAFVWIISTWLAFPLMASFGNMGLTYGALSGVMLALLFFYVIGFALVFGAEVNASIARARGCGEARYSS